MSDLTGELMRDLDRRLQPQLGSRVSGKVVKFDGLTAHCDGFPAISVGLGWQLGRRRDV